MGKLTGLYIFLIAVFSVIAACLYSLQRLLSY